MKRLRTILFRFYNWIQPLMTPGLRNAQFAYRDTLASLLSPSVRWLDIGCGRRLFPQWMPGSDELQTEMLDKVKSAFGLDPDLPSLRDNHFLRARVQGESSKLPFAGGSFDLVTANMVVEHIVDPGALLFEAHKALAPGGLFLFHTPNFYSYATILAWLVPDSIKTRLVGFFEGRKEEDVFPTLYRMNTASSVKRFAAQHGFVVQSLRHTESSAQAVMLGPLVIFELLWILMLRASFLSGLRSNLIVILRKSE
jgi:SAM-dependent methyltransferase